jgi:orotate phosphoribosyltransferase
VTPVSFAKEQLIRLLRDKAYREGDFVLSSGQHADFYIDAKQVTYDPEGATLVGRAVCQLLLDHGVEAVGGLTLGADSIATAVAIASYATATPIPAFVVRKEAKQHGLQKWIEGPDPSGRRVAIVDDVITTGGSVIQAIRRVQEIGCEVIVVVALVDREQGGRERIEELGCRFLSICTISDLRTASLKLA